MINCLFSIAIISQSALVLLMDCCGVVFCCFGMGLSGRCWTSLFCCWFSSFEFFARNLLWVKLFILGIICYGSGSFFSMYWNFHFVAVVFKDGHVA